MEVPLNVYVYIQYIAVYYSYRLNYALQILPYNF